MTLWLFLLFFAAQVCYEFAENRGAAFASGNGALLAILFFHIRGPKLKAHWWLCMWAAFEGWQTFICQGVYNWFPVEVDRYHGMCESYTGLPLFLWGLGAALFVLIKIIQEQRNG